MTFFFGDIEVEKVFAQAGATVVGMGAAALRAWRDVARETAWKDYAARSKTCAELLKLAQAVA
jgi:hypothetical protein